MCDYGLSQVQLSNVHTTRTELTWTSWPNYTKGVEVCNTVFMGPTLQPVVQPAVTCLRTLRRVQKSNVSITTYTLYWLATNNAPSCSLSSEHVRILQCMDRSCNARSPRTPVRAVWTFPLESVQSELSSLCDLNEALQLERLGAVGRPRSYMRVETYISAISRNRNDAVALQN